MGQFLQGGKNGRLMSFFFKVEPPCDQTWWDSLVFSILSCFSYVVHAENTLVDDFPFFSSSLACLEPELELFEVWEINVRQIIIIANGINVKQPL